MRVERYEPCMVNDWDAFVRSSRNGTFLFERGYMDYHANRFPDHSLVVRDDDGKLIALLPAHAINDGVASHQGLSYGGVVSNGRMKLPLFLKTFEMILTHLRNAGFPALAYKTVPHIYHHQPSEDDRYALFLLGAELMRRDALSVVNLGDRLPYQNRRGRGIKKAEAAGVVVKQEAAFAEFWPVLKATLSRRFNAEPVHSLDEMQLLYSRFPLNIRLHSARSDGGELLAGVVTFLTENAVHCQYIAASNTAREKCALDLLFDHLLHDVSHDCSYFDFGSSHEQAGRAVNEGLIDQKEGFGARTITHDHYRIDLRTIQPGILTGALK